MRLLLVVLACLLSAPALAAFTDNGDGTVTDSATGLMWQRCAVGQTWTGSTCSGGGTTYTWDAAVALTDSYAGHTDWRLPTLTELQSLVQLGSNPTIDTTAFPNTPVEKYFWSGESYVIPDRAWGIFFNNGNTYPGLKAINLFYVRLVRVGSVKPSCTLTASSPSIGLGGSSTLTASCSPAATSYTWTGGTCAGNNTNTCTASPVATTTYSVAGSNASGIGSYASVVVVMVVPPSCTLTASPTSIGLGDSTTLTASCSPAGTIYTWTGGTCAGNTTKTCIVAPTTTTTYAVQGTNEVGTGTAATVRVTVLADPGCPNGYTYSVVPITWSADTTGPLQTMNHCEAKAYQFVMPSHTSSISATVNASVPKYLSLSQTAFDFSPALEAAGCAGAAYNDPTIASSTTGQPGLCQVTQGATYYLNVRNAASSNGADNCPAGSSCSFYLNWLRATVTVPPSCTLTATPPSISAGGSSTLTANCSPAAIYYSWSGGSCAGNTTNTCTASPAATTAYTVAGINASGTGAAASATVTVTFRAPGHGVNTDSVQRLYLAYFNRPADPAGLAAFEALLSPTVAATQAQLTTIAAYISSSPEYAALYAGQSNAQIIDSLYMNLFGRHCESTVVQNTWAGWLTDGTYTFDQIALQLTFSAQGTDATAIANKLAAATAFTTALNTTVKVGGYSGTVAAARVRAWLATVTDVAATLAAATASVDAVVTSLAPSATTIANLPPDPGTAATATLKGVDTNGNTVRDEVERTASASASTKDSWDQTMAAAASFQSILETKNSTQAQAQAKAAEIYCKELGRSDTSKNEMPTDLMLALTYDTPERWREYSSYLLLFGATVTDAGAITCN